MRKFRCLAVFAVVSVWLMVTAPATASRLPLGLDIRAGVYVQEILQGARPYLCVSNQTANPQLLQVARWRSRQLSAIPIVRWPVSAGESRCHDASSLTAQSLLEFSLVGGKRLGLLRAPGAPAAQATDPAALASVQGLNGTCPTPGTWIEQPTLWLQGGTTAEVTLFTTVTSDGTRIELPVDSGLSLPQLQIRSVTSSSLVVNREGQRFVIRTRTPGLHRAQITLDVAHVNMPSMYLLSGRKSIADSGWQCFVRGILFGP